MTLYCSFKHSDNYYVKSIWLIHFLCTFFAVVSVAQASPHTVNSAAQNLNLTQVIQGSPEVLPGIQKIYTDELMNQFLVVAENVPGKIEKPYLEERNDYLYVELPNGNQTHIVVGAYHVSLEQWQRASKLSGNSKKSFAFNVLNAAIPNAAANDLSCNSNSNPGTVQSFLNSGFMSATVGCATGLLKGAWDGTVGTAKGFFSSVKTLVTEPKKFMDETVQSVVQLKNFILNINKELTSALSAFSSLPNDLKAEILCSFVGSLGAQALIAILVTKKIPQEFFTKITSFTQKLKNIMSEIEILVKYKFSNKSKELIKCAL